MGYAVKLQAGNDNCPNQRLKRAVKLLEQAVEKNKLACQEFKKTISDLRESVQNLEEGTATFQKKWARSPQESSTPAVCRKSS